jgi:GT2 family glycosyltransferase
LLHCFRADDQVAACQPKLLSIQRPTFFDYAGACGGLLDIFGYPFTRGRIFQHIEKDEGQYDGARQTFWATGACVMLRRSALQTTGLFDEDFFAHMEEIDLCWRLQIAGYRVQVAPSSVVRHQAGSTLRQHSPQKIYLNHRNSLVMLLKNYSLLSIAWILPLRLALEIVTVFAYGAWSDMRSAAAVARAFGGFLARIPATLKKRAAVQQVRRRSDRELRALLYRRSIVIDYFVLRRQTWAQLEHA